MIQIFKQLCDAGNGALDWQGNLYVIGNEGNNATIKRVRADNQQVELIKTFSGSDTGKEGRGHFVLPGRNGRLWYGLSTRINDKQGFYVGWLDGVVPLPPEMPPIYEADYQSDAEYDSPPGRYARENKQKRLLIALRDALQRLGVVQ